MASAVLTFPVSPGATRSDGCPLPPNVTVDDLGPRGIYRFEGSVEGYPAYFALTRKGVDVPPGLRVVWPGESAAIIVTQLERELDRIDPIRPRPQLVR